MWAFAGGLATAVVLVIVLGVILHALMTTPAGTHTEGPVDGGFYMLALRSTDAGVLPLRVLYQYTEEDGWIVVTTRRLDDSEHPLPVDALMAAATDPAEAAPQGGYGLTGAGTPAPWMDDEEST